MTTGLQYYHNGAFKTFPLPSGNGTFVLSNYNNDFTWVDSGAVVPDQPEEFTTLDNSYFKDSNSQAITIATRGTIPYFVNNSTFGGLDLPGSGKYLLNIEDDGEPSFSTFSKSTISTELGFGNTSNNSHTNLFLPDQSGTYILKATDAGAFGNTYEFSELNAVGLFHEALGVESTNLSIIAYKGNSAFGVDVPAMNSSSGYFVFKNEKNTELPTTSILNSTVIYQDILGCTNTERCLVYNDGSSVSKLTVPTTAGSYVLNVSSSGVSFSTPPAKFSKTFTYSWSGSGHSVVSETLGSDNSNLTEDLTLSSNSKYLVTIDLSLKCGNYEQALVGFTSTPTLAITTFRATLLKTTLDNPTPTMNVSGTSIFSPLKDGGLQLVVSRSGDTTISHLYSNFQVTIVEL
ncbi:uncharacterized protein [Blastocystis hominis]|uniref:Uncharacterized protein n=1 Tax=Blastocystis hominis TaxID=12968 RepID=D8M190_BLAHO|nr:uncharacterized protein [Blastocystis hominis]CBK21829.2 unnamed protein product [Blastocystis hominis]|eukprot:XP_012895877.1 uncharacterized protein [Blastocystis hominis]